MFGCVLVHVASRQARSSFQQLFYLCSIVAELSNLCSSLEVDEVNILVSFAHHWKTNSYLNIKLSTKTKISLSNIFAVSSCLTMFLRPKLLLPDLKTGFDLLPPHLFVLSGFEAVRAGFSSAKTEQAQNLSTSHQFTFKYHILK